MKIKMNFRKSVNHKVCIIAEEDLPVESPNSLINNKCC